MDYFFRKNAVIGLAEILCRLPLILTVGYLAQNVGAEIFGNWALIVAFQVLVAGAAGLGLSSSLSRFVPAARSSEASGYLRYAFILSLSCIMAAAVLAYILRAPIGRLLGLKTELYWLLPIAVAMAAGSIGDSFLDAFFKASMEAGRQVLFVLARTLVEVVAVVIIFVIIPPFLDQAADRLAAYVGCVVVGKLAIYPWLFSGLATGATLPPPDTRREFLKYGLPMVPTLLVVWLASQSDRLVLSHFVTKSDLGIYAFGATLASYAAFLGYAVYPLLLPGANKLYDAGDTAGVSDLFQDCQRLFMPLWAAGMTCLALWSAEIIAWTGGGAFAGSARVLLILCFAVGVEKLMGMYQFVFHLVKRTDLIFWLNAGNAAILIAAMFMAGVTSGIELAPWAALAATLIFNVVRYRIALRYLDLPVASVLVLQVAAVAGWTALMFYYATELNDGVRAAITTAVVLALGICALQRKAVSTATALSPTAVGR